MTTTTTKPITTLKHGQAVRLPAWDAMTFAKVFTVGGYARDHGSDPASVRYEPPCATYAGTTITTDQGHYDRLRAQAARAAVVEDGELVVIEGALFRVRVVGRSYAAPRVSDPIHFQHEG